MYEKYVKWYVWKSMILAQNRNIDQWSGIESPEINPHTYSHLTYNKGVKNIQRRNVVLGKLDSCMEKKHIRTFSNTIHRKVNSKWIKDLNVNRQLFNVLEFPLCKGFRVSTCKLNTLPNHFVSKSHVKSIKNFNVTVYLFYESLLVVVHAIFIWNFNYLCLICQHKSFLPSQVMRHIKYL